MLPAIFAGSKTFASALPRTTANRMIERIRAAVTRLAASPALGRPGRVADTRELVIPHTPYIVPYRVKGDVVQIITILHSAQRWPDSLP
jgi:toxin ParE1/3/4